MKYYIEERTENSGSCTGSMTSKWGLIKRILKGWNKGTTIKITIQTLL